MKHYTAYPMWSNPRYKAVTLLSTLVTLLYALVWAFNFSGYNSTLPGAWLIVSIPLLASFFWHQSLTIGEATFFYQERFFGYTVFNVKSADLRKLHIREEMKWCCITFSEKDSRIVTDFYQHKKHAPTTRSPFSNEALVTQQGH